MKKTIIIANLVLIFLLIFWFHFSSENTELKVTNEITIFTLNPLISIHSKMISGNDENIYTVSKKKLSKSDFNNLDEASIIFGTEDFSKSSLREEEKYKSRYRVIPGFKNSEYETYSFVELKTQIETIRDNLVSINDSKQGDYYDNAGNYIHLLDTTLSGFKTRISEYTKIPFITVGNELDSFINTLGIEAFQEKKYASLVDYISERQSQLKIKEGVKAYVFISAPLSDAEKKKYEYEYNIIIHAVPSLEKDLSRWGYIRFIEKIMNDFIAVFDTYD